MVLSLKTPPGGLLRNIICILMPKKRMKELSKNKTKQTSFYLHVSEKKTEGRTKRAAFLDSGRGSHECFCNRS